MFTWLLFLLLFADVLGCNRSGEPDEAPKRFDRFQLSLEKKGEAGGRGGLVLKESEGGGAGKADSPGAAMPAAPADETASLANEEADLRDSNEPSRKRQDGRSENAVEIARSRSWFPETLLFRPGARTDDSGQAVVEFQVPDRLTTWRILGLAHAKSGAQGGSVARFEGTLPTYVEPVVPAFVIAQDEIDLPIQVVNTSREVASLPLKVDVSGAARATMTRTVRVPPQSSSTEWMRFSANHPGEISIVASLGNEDETAHTVPVYSAYPASFEQRSGTLAGPRSFETTLPKDIEPSSARLRLTVFPGALSIIRAELSAASRSSSDEDSAKDAYALQLAGEAPRLLENLGEHANMEELRALRIRAGQKVIRRARAPSTALIPALLAATSAHPNDPVLARMTKRLELTLAQAESPDGFFHGEDGWSVERLLVYTASAVEALSSSMTAPEEQSRLEVIRLRASGAFERNAARITDGYTAAAVLATGVPLGGLEEKLRKIIESQIETVEDGGKVLRVSQERERADGSQPSEVEATALAIIALTQPSSTQASADGEQLVADLATSVLGAYRSGRGFGDGETSQLALRALLKVFHTPIPEGIEVVALLDDQPIASTVLNGDRRKDVAVLEAPTPTVGGEHRWTIRSTPAVPGLGFAFNLETHQPTTSAPGGSINDRPRFTLKPEGVLRTTEPQTITVRAAAPTRSNLVIECALPAGVIPVASSLERLVSAGALTRFELRESGPVLYASTGSSTDVAISFTVIPRFAGQLSTGTSRLVIQPNNVQYLPPARWSIQRRS